MGVISSSSRQAITPEDILAVIPQTSLPTTQIDAVEKIELGGVYTFVYKYNNAQLFYVEISNVSGDWQWLLSVYPNELLEDGFVTLLEDSEQLLLEG